MTLKRLLTVLLLLLPFAPERLSAQVTELQVTDVQTTGASGTVRDAETGEPLSFVTIYYPDTRTGTISDLDGRFFLTTSTGHQTIAFQSMGYKTQFLTLREGKVREDLDIRLVPDIFDLDVIEVRASKNKERYKRKDNPAVALLKEVLAHKDSNSVFKGKTYKATLYEKRVLALEQDSFNFEKNGTLRKLRFLEKYIDSSELNGHDLLSVSLKENRGEFYYRDKPRTRKRIIENERLQGVEQLIREASLWVNLEQTLPMVNLYDNDITLLLNKFVSPISSTLAVSFYKYYIMDTVALDGEPCVDLAFVPVNSESCGFTGHLCITLDGSFAVKRAQLSVPRHINLNFVNNLNLVQDFERLENGVWGLKRTDTYVNFYILKNRRRLYVRQTLAFDSYDFGVSATDTLFSMSGDVLRPDPMPALSREEWDSLRPVALTIKEGLVDSLVTEMNRVPTFRHLMKTVQVAASSYIPTTPDIQDSKFDIGPLWSFVSWNKLEGARFRIGGMSTGKLNEHFFVSGYMAFGTSDWHNYARNFGAASGAEHGIKYNLTLAYSFAPKKHHPYEAFRDALFLSSEFDTYEAGRLYPLCEKDNIFMNIPFSKPKDKYMQYIRRTELRYEKEWPNRMRIKAFAQHEINEAAGALAYRRYVGAGEVNRVLVQEKDFHAVEVGLEMRYAPGEPLYDNRNGRESLFNMSTDAPVIKVGHRVGLFNYRQLYNITEFSVDYRLWMSSFGHIDFTLRSGIQWNKISFPKLFLPNANTSIVMQPKSFCLMQPLEFICDQYASLHLTYYMKGLLLNRIPGVKRLQLREVISFSALYGRLSPKNNPFSYGNDALYRLPETAHPMGAGMRYNGTNDKVPYMEMSVGIENIFKFIRIDYVRRLNYIGGLGGWQRNGVRVSFRFAL